MIELVAHKDNSWPGAFRLHMKDSGMLLGIGHDVTAVVETRLKEEGIEGDYRVVFPDGSRVKRGRVARAKPQWEEPEHAIVEVGIDNPFADDEEAAAAWRKRWQIEKDEPEVDDPFSDPIELDRHGKPVKAPEPVGDKTLVEAADLDRHGKPVKPASKPKPKAKPVEKFVLPPLKPIAPRATDAEKAAAKRAAAKRKR